MGDEQRVIRMSYPELATYSEPKNAAWRDRLAKVFLSRPGPFQGDSRDDFGLYVDAIFGETSFTNEELGFSKARDPDATAVVIRVQACMLRLDLEACRINLHAPIRGDNDAERKESDLEELIHEQDSTLARLRAGIGARFSLQTSDGSVSLLANRERESQKKVEVKIRRELPTKEAKSYGDGQWLIYDRAAPVLAGYYIRSTDGPLCRLRPLHAQTSICASIVCYGVDLEPSFPNGSHFRAAKSFFQNNHRKLIAVAIKRGLGRVRGENNLIELARSEMTGGEQNAQ